MRCPFCRKRTKREKPACAEHLTESARLSARAALEGLAAYQDEVDWLEELWPAAWAGKVDAIASGQVADDLRTELRERGPRTAAKLHEELDLPHFVVFVVALALEQRGEVVVRSRSRKPAALARAFVELVR